uniref:Uncharacterized protein n=1 Tax=Picea glauca TaxID=3330 RepID=A0A124GN75_PICGL|nr:hypothetical protein ABT39_MTgene4928 [Picea glauca]
MESIIVLRKHKEATIYLILSLLQKRKIQLSYHHSELLTTNR